MWNFDLISVVVRLIVVVDEQLPECWTRMTKEERMHKMCVNIFQLATSAVAFAIYFSSMCNVHTRSVAVTDFINFRWECQIGSECGLNTVTRIFTQSKIAVEAFSGFFFLIQLPLERTFFKLLIAAWIHYKCLHSQLSSNISVMSWAIFERISLEEIM